jgi:dihydrofolate synthase/folylpolyglutamate synthase
MKNTPVSTQTTTSNVALGKQRTYGEIIELLDARWHLNTTDLALTSITAIDKALGYLSKKINAIIVGGTNGKSIAVEFTAKILAHEGLKVGSFMAPHILTYNERFSINGEHVNNKLFTEIANQILTIIEAEEITAGTRDILAGMALVYFSTSNVDVAVLELEDIKDSRPIALLSPQIVGITRITNNEANNTIPVSDDSIYSMLSIIKKNTHIVSADQSKTTLQTMQRVATGLGGIWSMPIRKLSPLPYPFEQLHGRCAALAERLAQLFVNSFIPTLDKEQSLLTKKKGQRGRPTLEAKRASEINPKKTVEQFWKETQCDLNGRFQLLDKEKPTVLLDNASNLDGFKNLLLGIRLLHYYKPLKGLTLIVGCNNEAMDTTEFTKTLRYFFKKTSGQIFFVPVESIPGDTKSAALDIEKLTNNAKSMKIKARSAASLAQAFDLASKSVDDRNGLVVITGSSSIISQYWHYKGIKKIQ